MSVSGVLIKRPGWVASLSIVGAALTLTIGSIPSHS